MYVISANKTTGEAIGSFLGAVFLVPYVAMLCLGALAHRNNIPELALGYWDLVLVWFVLAMVRGSKPHKWYIGREK